MSDEIFDALHAVERHAEATNDKELMEMTHAAQHTAGKEILEIDLNEGSSEYQAVMREIYPFLSEEPR